MERNCYQCHYGDSLGHCLYLGHCTKGDKWVSKVEIINNAKSKIGKFESVGTKLGVLLDEKRKAYGNGATTATEILKILYPNGVNVNQYQDMLLMVRVLDKLCRISNAKGAFNENPWMDIAGYGMLGSEE